MTKFTQPDTDTAQIDTVSPLFTVGLMLSQGSSQSGQKRRCASVCQHCRFKWGVPKQKIIQSSVSVSRKRWMSGTWFNTFVWLFSWQNTVSFFRIMSKPRHPTSIQFWSRRSFWWIVIYSWLIIIILVHYLLHKQHNKFTNDIKTDNNLGLINNTLTQRKSPSLTRQETTITAQVSLSTALK